MSQTDIVERLRKGPMSDHHFNEAADTITQLRERLAAVEKERDKALRYGAPENSTALSHVKNPCTKHNQYWTTHSGGCMACRANDAEKERDQLRRSNERLEKEKAELCKQWQRQRAQKQARQHARKERKWHRRQERRWTQKRSGGWPAIFDNRPRSPL